LSRREDALLKRRFAAGQIPTSRAIHSITTLVIPMVCERMWAALLMLMPGLFSRT
jgi:hypothetical protein